MSIIEKLGITPGPWEIGDKSKNESNLMVYCCDVTGQRIADCTNDYTYHTIKDKEANSLLISAAPEMLEALMLTMTALENDEAITDTIWVPNILSETLFERCQYIVQKATGKSWEEIKVLL